MTSATTVLLATDTFKGHLTATDVCAELRRGLLAGAARIEVVVRPVADGGEGTLDAALAVVGTARLAGTPVIAVAGDFTADADLTGTVARYSLTERAGTDGDPMRDARPLLRQIGARIHRDLSAAR